MLARAPPVARAASPSSCGGTSGSSSRASSGARGARTARGPRRPPRSAGCLAPSASARPDARRHRLGGDRASTSKSPRPTADDVLVTATAARFRRHEARRAPRPTSSRRARPRSRRAAPTAPAEPPHRPPPVASSDVMPSSSTASADSATAARIAPRSRSPSQSSERPAITFSASSRFDSSSWSIRSSSVPRQIRLCTNTGLRWPTRCTRSVACCSTAGFHQRSKWNTWFAAGRFRPRPPALIEITSTDGPSSVANAAAARRAAAR